MGLEFKSTGLKKLALNVIQGAIVEEPIIDVDIILERQSICSSCDMMDQVNAMCSVCKCFLEVKTKSKVNKKFPIGSEITHCPLNKWLDEFSKLGYQIKNDTIKS